MKHHARQCPRCGSTDLAAEAVHVLLCQDCGLWMAAVTATRAAAEAHEAAEQEVNGGDGRDERQR